MTIKSLFRHACLNTLALIYLGIGSNAIASENSAVSEAWTFNIGAGFIITPLYTGDDEQEILLVPSVQATKGEHWELSVRKGVQYTINPNATRRWAVALAPKFGRSTDGENPFRIAGDATKDLIGLAEIDAAPEIRLLLDADFGRWTASATMNGTLAEEPQTSFSLGISRGGRVMTFGPPLILSAGAELLLGDQQTLQNLVGVSIAESANAELPVYRPGAGVVSVGVSGTGILPLSRSLAVVGTLSISTLGSELTDSDLVRNRGAETQITTGLFIDYKIK